MEITWIELKKDNIVLMTLKIVWKSNPSTLFPATLRFYFRMKQKTIKDVKDRDKIFDFMPAFSYHKKVIYKFINFNSY